MSYSSLGDCACPSPEEYNRYKEKTDAMVYTHVGSIAVLLLAGLGALVYFTAKKR